MANATVFPLAFPYFEGENSSTLLSRLILTDDNDTSRYSITIKKGTCNGIEHYDTKRKKPTEVTLKFVSNDSASHPLLLCVPSSHRKLKLQLVVSQTAKDTAHLLTILKTRGRDNDPVELKKYLALANYTEQDRDVSLISLSKLILNGVPESVVINDTLDASQANLKLHVTVWEQRGTSLLLSFSFLLWIDGDTSPIQTAIEAPTVASNKKSTATIPNRVTVPLIKTKPDVVTTSTFTATEFRKVYNFSIDDGPEFRSLLNRYEHNMPKLKRVMQSLNEEVRVLESCLRKISVSKSNLLELLDSLVDTQFNPLLRRLKLVKRFTRQFLLMFSPIEQNLGLLIKEVFNVPGFPKMLNCFNSVIPHEGSELTSSKKAFEKNSKEYYEWLNKYLSNEKDRPELKLLLKRKVFETSKFDYLNTLNGALNNQYFNQFLENLLKFSHMKMDSNGVFDFSTFKNSMPAQQLLSKDDMLYLTSLSRFNSEKLQMRQMIEACRSNEELTNLIKYNPLNYKVDDEVSGIGDTLTIDLDLVFPPIGSSAVIQSPINISPVEEIGQMSGILYALGGKGKPGWHKEWVVLRNGQLLEFSDWRKGHVPINKPVDIALSNVKATTHDKRQYCFEIVTSQKQKHVFQAMNNDERNQWMRALYNAGQITLNLVNSTSKPMGKLSKIRTKFDLPLPPQVSSQNENDRQGSPVSIVSTSRIASTNTSHLDMVRSIEGAKNEMCADCGSTESVEWVSSNILVVICVNCSSCHRHMGTHVSKVRSLRLDHFADESLVLLDYVNNARANEYLQHGVKGIEPDSKDEERLVFIKRKYEKLAFMETVTDLNSALVHAVRKIDIFGVIKCLNCGADPNLRLEVASNSDAGPTIITLFEYSLRKAVKVDTRDYFVVSELLLLHGCNIESIDKLHPAFKFSAEARAYFGKKRLRVV